MAVFRVILVTFPVIPFSDKGKAQGVCFLTEGVPYIFFICQQVKDCRLLPVGSAIRRLKAFLRHLRRNPGQAVSAEVAVKDPPHLFRFFRDDL